MASEPTEEGVVTVDLSEGLDEWLDEHAAELGVSRGELVTQLLASYRATAELEGDGSALVDVDSAVERELGDQLDASVAATVDEKLDSALGDRLPDMADAVEARLDDRFEQVEGDFQAKLDDVRQRVVQLKRELDAKAAEDHDHDAFDDIDDLEREIADLGETVDSLRTDLETHRSETDDDLSDLDSRFEDAEDRLERVAWVVNDLRKDSGGRDAHQKAVDRIKRAAAQEGVSSATCENCAESVDISLLTDPQCPHCDATVSDVRPEGGILRKKARLIAAAQLEAGDTDE